MSCVAFSRLRMAWPLAIALLLTGTTAARAQDSGRTTADRQTEIIASEIGLSRDQAALRLELAGGRTLTLELRDDHAWLNGTRVGPAPRGDELDRSWRALLNDAMDAPTSELPKLLSNWDAPSGEAGERLDRVLESTFGGLAGAQVPASPAADAVSDDDRWASDTVARLNQKIAELESRLEDARGASDVTRIYRVENERRGWPAPFRRLFRGIANIFSILAVYAVLVGIGFAVVFFGRKYLEGVADTARHATVQSGLVGLAASFLVVPAFILGAIALTISIVGIPALIVWLPLFPVAVTLAAIFGYLGVAHAAGEALAERRFDGGELFKRANSYYYVLTGAGLLLALYIAANVVEIAGPWLDFITGMLNFLAVVLTWAAFTIGFGAVLLSRAGTRPKTIRPLESEVDTDPVFEEESHV